MRRPWFTRLVLCALVVTLMPGCGTVFFLFLPRGVKVDSNPPGATVWLDNEAQEDVTPVKVAAWPQEDHVVSATATTEQGVELKGQTTLTRGVRVGVIVLDALFTGGLGIFVDWLTGAIYHFNQSTVVLNLGNHAQIQAETVSGGSVDRPLREDWPAPREDRPPREDSWEEGETVRSLLEDDEPGPHVEKDTPPPVVNDAEETESALEDTPIAPTAEPCRICGEARGDAVPCPSCGMD